MRRFRIAVQQCRLFQQVQFERRAYVFAPTTSTVASAASKGQNRGGGHHGIAASSSFFLSSGRPYCTTKPDHGTIMAERDLYLKAIEVDPSNSVAYFNLALLLFVHEKVALHDGTIMTDRDLYLKVIELDPSNSKAYLNLGMSLSADEKVTLHDGTIMTDRDLFLKAVELDPSNSTLYLNLAMAKRDRHTQGCSSAWEQRSHQTKRDDRKTDDSDFFF